MGQYHHIVNLDKMQQIDPHALGAGLKLWEQLAAHPGTGAALIVLLASKSNGEGGGDLKADPIVGSWCGDRIAMVGDYDTKSTYATPSGPMTGADIYGADWEDVSDAVCAVIAAELEVEFTGSGWRDVVPAKATA